MTREELTQLADAIAAELLAQRRALDAARTCIRDLDERLMVLNTQIRRLPPSLDHELIFTRSVA